MRQLAHQSHAPSSSAVGFGVLQTALSMSSHLRKTGGMVASGDE
jgi:hypothetical protein